MLDSKNPDTIIAFSFAQHTAKAHAGIAQLVERNLAKVEVASSRLVSRSSFARNKNFQKPTNLLRTPSRGAVAKRLCTGLQIRVGRFDSGPRLQIHNKQAL